MFIINDQTSSDVIYDTAFGRGLIPRNMATHPIGCYGNIPEAAIDMPVLTKTEMLDRIRYNKANNSTGRAIRRNRGPNNGKVPSLNQGAFPYCWTHSGTMSVMLARLKAGLPYLRLSAMAIACIMKNYKAVGGWGADAVAFMAARGVPTTEFWMEGSNLRKWDTPQTWESAALHKVEEGWIDMQTEVWDRTMTYAQQMSFLCSGGIIVGDFNWWGHSVCLFDADELDGEPVPVGLNSWGDAYGDQGEFTLQGDRAIMSGGVGIRFTTPSVN